MVIFNSYVKLPEGIHFFFNGKLRFAIAMFNYHRVMIIDTRSFQNLQNGSVARRRSDRAAPMHQNLWMFLD